ncbi:dihydrolipoamide acetyltransferase family protein [Mycolicibacterium aichiense]|uniref:Dihydrolipoamide acetyltransferase component of pyruvate dehydrogenase complex n=1 Tax=Mycolicibacterium aichiense TaxID=1799 RepID=A0AAD1HQ28_9MYCO|nr:dihydrolipoamide acetyltransferase family protein [Mycolicibacterium aichiense]MCV7021604.1 2-oxo acid dehydrogenase subunit E2 [Mycolicibacterium aichiense]BBX08906.1 dihydrolipoamide acetyltransferase component of pyruvate dehydrogenase complex [Mycolicibacterium aichiense]STZ82699.1 dihydrolipoamide S-acetyltransferase E2 component PdhC [Mycolicibacterium aichiense]
MSDFLVPDLGEGLEDATITSWAVAVGDVVELNQTLCTVETNKAEVEIPSPYAGRVEALGGAEGETLAVGTLLVSIETSARTPVLVGYGIDDGMDRSRRARAAPKTRKLAADLAVDLNGLRPGSGADGVITRDDVLDAAGSAPTSQSIPVRGVQARMAAHMSLSRSRIPDAHASVQVDGTALLRLRDQLGVTPFVLTLRLLVIALGRHPVLNATWVDAEAGPEIRLHPDVRLGVAVATERGLVVPVVDTRGRSTRHLAAAVDDVIERARAGTLAPTQLSGSTFTVSNFGALGLDDGVPVINYPEAAILGMGSLKPRAVVVDGAVVARPTMTLTCAFDHRIADGAQTAAFLTDLRGLIESPDTALLDL